MSMSTFSSNAPALSTEGGAALTVVDVQCAEEGDEGLVPSPNVAELGGALGTSARVRIRHRRTVVVGSVQPMSKAAQPLLGAVSGVPSSKVVVQGGSSKVYAELRRMGTLGSPASPPNAPAGLVVVPTQTQIRVAR